jgi:hypothetical protein
MSETRIEIQYENKKEKKMGEVRKREKDGEEEVKETQKRGKTGNEGNK